MALPPDLRNAVARPGGGQIVLVIGAGCSLDPPTRLPLSRDLSREAHRRLLEDGVLNIACANPEDLSSVADAVWNGVEPHSQRALIDRLPVDEFRNAKPNEGYLLVSAMLREKAISCVISLNFDLAISHALSHVGARDDVAVITGPEDHRNLRAENVIYLHRCAYASPDDWILRSDVLANAWRGKWEEVIVRRFVAGPTTVFVGLGSPAAVLLESTAAIRSAIPEGLQIYQVDPGARGSSEFSENLGITEREYLQMDWLTFTRELAARLLEEHRTTLENVGRDLVRDNGWEVEDVWALSHRIADLGLLGYGELRARWFLTDDSYVPTDNYTSRWVADLMLVIGMFERRTTGVLAQFAPDGIVEFYRDSQLIGSIVIGHGLGSTRWLVMESKLKHNSRYWRKGIQKPRFAVISGVTDALPAVATPPDVVGEINEDSLLGTTSDALELFSVDQIRATPEIIHHIVGHNV